MDRHNFISLTCKTGLALVISTSPVRLFSLPKTDDEIYSKNIRLLKRIAGYARELGLQVSNDFYTKWKAVRNSPYIYLYVSYADKILSPKGINSFGYVEEGTEEEKIQRQAAAYNSSGLFHITIYRTAGTSSTELNTVLLSYHPASISFIGFHEAAHQHIHSKTSYIPYIFEEACCDVIGNAATKLFAQSDFAFSYRAAVMQEEQIEAIYASIIDSINLYENGKNSSPEDIYSQCQRGIEHLLPMNNKFLVTRFTYPVNNAYFLRNKYYAQYYPLMKEVMLLLGIKDFIKFISALPKDEMETLKILKGIVSN